MPSSQTVIDFVDMVVAGQFVEAMERFYAEDAWAQENVAPPRVGRSALIENERATLGRYAAVRAELAEPPLISGNRVVLHWLFEFDHPAGPTLRLDELALQQWRGEQLAGERFFYDPRQLAVMQPRAEEPCD